MEFISGVWLEGSIGTMWVELNAGIINVCLQGSAVPAAQQHCNFPISFRANKRASIGIGAVLMPK
jgi:hypothetical protein